MKRKKVKQKILNIIGEKIINKLRDIDRIIGLLDLLF